MLPNDRRFGCNAAAALSTADGTEISTGLNRWVPGEAPLPARLPAGRLRPTRSAPYYS